MYISSNSISPRVVLGFRRWGPLTFSETLRRNCCFLPEFSTLRGFRGQRRRSAIIVQRIGPLPPPPRFAPSLSRILPKTGPEGRVYARLDMGSCCRPGSGGGSERILDRGGADWGGPRRTTPSNGNTIEYPDTYPARSQEAGPSLFRSGPVCVR